MGAGGGLQLPEGCAQDRRVKKNTWILRIVFVSACACDRGKAEDSADSGPVQRLAQQKVPPQEEL